MKRFWILGFVMVALLLVASACENEGHTETWDKNLNASQDCRQDCQTAFLRGVDSGCGEAQYCLALDSEESDWVAACDLVPTRCVDACTIVWDTNEMGETVRVGDSCADGYWCNQNLRHDYLGDEYHYCEAKSTGGSDVTGGDTGSGGGDVTEPDVTEPVEDVPEQPPVDLPCDDCEPVIQEVCCYWDTLSATPNGETVFGQFSFSSWTQLDPEAWEGIRDRTMHDGWACGYADLRLVSIGYWTSLTVCRAQDAEPQLGNCRWVNDMPPQTCTIDDEEVLVDDRINWGHGFAVGDFAHVPYDERD